MNVWLKVAGDGTVFGTEIVAVMPDGTEHRVEGVRALKTSLAIGEVAGYEQGYVGTLEVDFPASLPEPS